MIEAVLKAEEDVNDPASRLAALLAFFEPRLRDKFLDVVEAIVEAMPVKELVELIEAGRVIEVLDRIDAGARALAAEFTRTYFDAGERTSKFLSDALEIIIDFDQVNDRAVQMARRISLDAIVGFTEEQKAATRAAIVDGVTRGSNPIEQARGIRKSIGLTERQQLAVQNYRNALETLSTDALRRELRDHRFDSTVRTAIQSGEPLSKRQIDRMVERYRERMLKFRAETIARTEALTAVHAANHEAYEQAYEAGQIDPTTVIREWDTAADHRVRESHQAMHNQKRGAREPFLSGLGNSLMYPGDPNAPAADRIKCRCSVGTRIRIASLMTAAAFA